MPREVESAGQTLDKTPLGRRQNREGVAQLRVKGRVEEVLATRRAQIVVS